MIISISFITSSSFFIREAACPRLLSTPKTPPIFMHIMTLLSFSIPLEGNVWRRLGNGGFLAMTADLGVTQMGVGADVWLNPIQPDPDEIALIGSLIGDE